MSHASTRTALRAAARRLAAILLVALASSAMAETPAEGRSEARG